MPVRLGPFYVARPIRFILLSSCHRSSETALPRDLAMREGGSFAVTVELSRYFPDLAYSH
jgi:hypothetical protein